MELPPASDQPSPRERSKFCADGHRGSKAQRVRRRQPAVASKQQAMSEGYQARDAAIVDYDLWQPATQGVWLRGPRPASLQAGSYFACVGAAQTFGCFVNQP